MRDGDLEEAINAYREADRRAPQEERGAIANRIALGSRRRATTSPHVASSTARGAYATYPAYVTWALIAANVIVFVADLVSQGGSINILGGTGQPMPAGWIYAPAVADGEWYRLVTSMFLHFGIVHRLQHVRAVPVRAAPGAAVRAHRLPDHLLPVRHRRRRDDHSVRPRVRRRRRIGRDLRPFRRGVHGLRRRHLLLGPRAPSSRRLAPSCSSTWSSPSPSRASAGRGTLAACWWAG